MNWPHTADCTWSQDRGRYTTIPQQREIYYHTMAEGDTLPYHGRGRCTIPRQREIYYHTTAEGDTLPYYSRGRYTTIPQQREIYYHTTAEGDTLPYHSRGRYTTIPLVSRCSWWACSPPNAKLLTPRWAKWIQELHARHLLCTIRNTEDSPTNTPCGRLTRLLG